AASLLRRTLTRPSSNATVASVRYGNGRSGRAPSSCFGIDPLRGGSAGACAHFWAPTSDPDVFGNAGIEYVAVSKSNADVRSPQTARRHAEMFGSGTPSHVSRNRITEL